MRNDERLRTIYEVMAPYIVRSERNWRDYLAFASRFHKQSFDKGSRDSTKMFELLSKLSAAIQTKQQFEEQGEASPEAPAAVDEDEQDMEL